MATNLDFGKTFNASIMNAVKYKMDFDENKLREDMRMAREEARAELAQRNYIEARDYSIDRDKLLDTERKNAAIQAQTNYDTTRGDNLFANAQTELRLLQKDNMDFEKFSSDLITASINQNTAKFNHQEDVEAKEKKQLTIDTRARINKVLRESIRKFHDTSGSSYLYGDMDATLDYIRKNLSNNDMNNAIENKLFDPFFNDLNQNVEKEPDELSWISQMGLGMGGEFGSPLAQILTLGGNYTKVKHQNLANAGKLTKAQIEQMRLFIQGMSQYNNQSKNRSK